MCVCVFGFGLKSALGSYFCKNAPLKIFDSVLDMPWVLNMP